MKDTELEYKTGLAKRLDASPDDIFLYWKGRVALYALLQAMNVGEGDEVILPAFTCVVVPNAILYLKARPVYVDIDPKTYNIDVEKIEAAITPKTKVLISQNTFGFSSNVEKICEIARQHQPTASAAPTKGNITEHTVTQHFSPHSGTSRSVPASVASPSLQMRI